MRMIPVVSALLATLALPVAVQAQAPCGEKGCKVMFDWGNGGATAPDVDRRYGSPTMLESEFVQALSAAGWHIVTTAAPVTITVRLSPQNRALCDVMPGVNPDYSCHTVQRAAVLFTSSDSTIKAPGRVEVSPHCSDPKANPSYAQFGRYAGELVVYTIVEPKGQKPGVKCS